MVQPIRTAARAVIIHDGKLLLVKMQDRRGVFYILPGGGQRPGETLEQAVERECQEETGCQVEVGKLLYIREYIGKNHTFSKSHRRFHQLEAVFEARITSRDNFGTGSENDKKQIGLSWIPVTELPHIEFYPKHVRDIIKDGQIEAANLYLGDVN